MRELLLINNEPTPEDRGRIVRAGELGLTDPLYNIDALSAKLSAFGTVTVRHYTQLRTLDSAPDAIFLRLLHRLGPRASARDLLPMSLR